MLLENEMSDIFTQEEMKKHRTVENELLTIAKKNPNPLYDFWRTKRNQFQQRMYQQWAI